jgi:ribonucleotide reductase alpha subunit
MAIAPERMGIGIRRRFTSPDRHPYETVTWERRDARIANYATGAVAFEQPGVEVPSTWSVNATNILAQKYFRGTLGTLDREWSLKQVVDRVADTITGWGRKDGYFVDDDEADAFRDELKYLIVHQRAAFNSPVWFNIGVKGVPAQASACFILSVDDSMSSILNWYVEEGIIFKGGSGSGINLSHIRSSKEGLRGGGTASGPVSFMRGADASAGTIKSGGKTRRAAKMVILNADHPDIEDFIWCKAIEERKARALRDAGFDMDLDGKDSYSIQYQNANNSIRVTDDFMQAVLDDADWSLRSVTTGEVLETIKARDLFRQIAKAAWECADPGMQFDTTINRWHTAPATGRINGSNPCCFVGETRVLTEVGLLTMADIAATCDAGGELPMVPTIDVIDGDRMVRPIVKAWAAGYTSRLVEVRTAGGGVFRCTPEHRFLTAGDEWVEAQDLLPWTELVALGGKDTIVSVEPVEPVDGVEVPVYDLEVAGTHNFAVAVDEDHAVVVHNSEYMHLDDSACNLASLNLLAFLDADGSFDVEGFKAATEVIFTAQEILVGNADYPTEKIAETSRRFRQLGIGYANLGALLMALGVPYDSDEGRATAAAITALLSGHSYATSARTAARMGPFAGYTGNRDAMLNVLRMHRSEVAKVDEELVAPELLSAAQEAWDTAVDVSEQYGARNSQASVLAPTGTIALLMDCDTTGIEPDLSLVKLKKLVGGGTMSIVNHTVPRALHRLGYTDDEVDTIVGYIDQHKTIVGAPGFRAEHLPVFACSMGDNPIHYRGHIRMMAAVQPFISGSISKTANLPEEATAEDVEQLFIESWQLGLKAVAIYRDNCKVAQPLATAKRTMADPGASEAETHDAELALKVAELEKALERQTVVVKQPIRERLPRRRRSSTFKFRVADCEGYVTVGEYDDGRPGEVFMQVSKQGSTLAGIMDAFAVAVSLGLQHGVPLATYVRKYTNMRFEPAGMTDDPDLRIATSLVDYIFRRLAVDYLPYEERVDLGILTTGERLQPTLPGVEEDSTPTSRFVDDFPDDEAGRTSPPAAAEVHQPPAQLDAPYCYQCGVQMLRAGTCFACPSCGNTSGCS